MNAYRMARSRRCRPYGYTLLLLVSFPWQLAGQAVTSNPGATFSVNADLVVLNVTARDRAGDFISTLRPEDFRVYEDGRPQEIRLFRHEDIPVTVGLLVDNSSSMGSKRNDVTAAALAFVRSSNPRDEIFIVNFNDRVTFGLPSQELFSANPAELERALNHLPPYGMTALYDAIEAGLEHMQKATTGKKVLIVISDGGDNASHYKLSQVLEAAERSDVMIYTIGIFDEHNGDQNPRVLRKLASATGGEAFFPTESSQMTSICQRIAADIRHQYTIGYIPSNPKLDNTYRSIRVTVKNPRGGKVFVRTRDGYIASPRQDSSADPVGAP